MKREMNRVHLQGVVKKKGTFTLYAEGEFFPGVHLITGKVGSGKTSLGEILAGIHTPDEGTISWEGNMRVMLLQDTSYHVTTITVREEAASWHGNADQIISLAGLADKKDTDLFSLSRGELKRLILAAILTGKYDIIVLDEPYAGLDNEARKWVNRIIEISENQVIVIISHDITSLPDVQYLWEMDEGKLFCIGRVPEELKNWNRPPPLVRYLWRNGIILEGLARYDLEKAVCRIPE
ncbi:MAG: ATP-binding cassette domain-containing protein [Methanomicrobiales archaeon]|nr:ATP-binding cassette domain-containing protein [Methanomicrobiales archaeon]